jgi:hypothetical protein
MGHQAMHVADRFALSEPADCTRWRGYFREQG